MLRFVLALSVLIFTNCENRQIDWNDEEEIRSISRKSVNFSLLKKRIDKEISVYSESDSSIPYTGWVNTMFSDGKIKSLFYIENGMIEGQMLSWNDMGNLKEKNLYSRGIKNGKFTWFDDYNNKVEEGFYQNGLLHGTLVIWSSNGSLREKGNYKKGKRNGEWVFYDLNGKEWNRIEYIKGVATEN